MRSFLKLCAIAIALISLPAAFYAQEKKDNEPDDKFVRLMSAQSVRLLEIDGKSYRKAEGPARFLHNNTWLICDTALWDVEAQIIHAMGNVSIEQENTELHSDSLTYFVERNMAEFRGSLVELRDKDNNTLRTTYLDYNTKDSVAVFRNGGAMRDKNGQLIESLNGEYDSKIHTFYFYIDVNMFTDSVFIKTKELDYNSSTNVATFPMQVDSWKEDKMFSSRSGWYDRSRELFFFKKDVHLMSSTQEGWCDSLWVDRRNNNAEFRGNAQICDEKKGVTALAGKMEYTDSVSLVRIFNDPLVMIEAEEKKDTATVRDTVYFRADSIMYWTVRRHKLKPEDVSQAESRIKDLSTDPVANIRIKAAEEAAKKAQEAQDALDQAMGKPIAKNTDADSLSIKKDAPESIGIADADSLSIKKDAADSLGIADADSLSIKKDAADSLGIADADSLSIAKDSLANAPALDSTELGFVKAFGKVKVFRNKMQVVCDSLAYTDLDSLARLYKDPVIWNEVRHQYQADSIFLAVRDNSLQKAHLLSNAFIHVSESEKFMDQIRSTEMTAYFDKDGQLSRFDALGGATALFYIKEKEKIATANKAESTVLTADFKDGEISCITYFESPKSDAYPVAQMEQKDMILRGNSWRPELRPKSPAELSSRIPRASQRATYDAIPKAEFPQTEIYFKGYMARVYRELERSDSLRRARAALQDNPEADPLAMADSISLADSIPATNAADSLEMADSLAKADSLQGGVLTGAIDSCAVKDSTAKASGDSLKTEIPLTRKQLWEKKMAEREAARQARWDELDKLDALKQAAKDARREKRLAIREKKRLLRLMKQKAKEDRLRETYKMKFFNQMLKNNGYTD